MSDELDRLLENNRAWAARIQLEDAEFFSRLAAQQSPEYLWIGCSDSRVPANQVVDLMPGEVFVHRNVANIIPSDDSNCLSVVEFAVTVLKVRHIIVCGHYGCGGVQAAFEGRTEGRVGGWLSSIRKLRKDKADQLDGLPPEQALSRLCELNVLHQMRTLCKTDILRQAWSEGQDLTVHGWIYGIENGLLRDLSVSIDAGTDLSTLDV